MRNFINEMNRKARDFDEVNQIIVTSKEVARYPVLTDTEVYEHEVSKLDSPTLLDIKVAGIPMEFILRTAIGDFLVHREGYDYARYIGKLVYKDAGNAEVKLPVRSKVQKFKFELTEEELNDLEDSEYGVVESIIESILDQAAEQGWRYKYDR